MIQDRHSNRKKSNCLPARDGEIWATTTTGARTPGPKDQILPVMAVDFLGLYLQAGLTPACPVAQKPPLRHRQSIRLHSMPIALMTAV
jgi:hypothetical protein